MHSRAANEHVASGRKTPALFAAAADGHHEVKLCEAILKSSRAKKIGERIEVRLRRLVLSLICLATVYPAAHPRADEVEKKRTKDTTETSDTKLMNKNALEKALAEIRLRNFESALRILKPAAEAGGPEAQALLGQMFQAGWGMPPDYKQAFKWWSLAAEQGNTDAQWGLGLLYNDGKGVQQDDKEAADWWKRSAGGGNIKATVNLAFLYDEGRGVATSQKESARLFKQAAEAGEPFAQVKYGLKLLAGEGIDQNKVLGAAWLAVAAESPRIQKTSNATVFREQKEKAWNRLSTEEQRLAEKKKAEISERFENKQ